MELPGTLVLPVRKGDTSKDDISEEGWVELPYMSNQQVRMLLVRRSEWSFLICPTSKGAFSEEGWVELLHGLYVPPVREDAVKKK